MKDTACYHNQRYIICCHIKPFKNVSISPLAYQTHFQQSCECGSDNSWMSLLSCEQNAFWKWSHEPWKKGIQRVSEYHTGKCVPSMSTVWLGANKVPWTACLNTSEFLSTLASWTLPGHPIATDVTEAVTVINNCLHHNTVPSFAVEEINLVVLWCYVWLARAPSIAPAQFGKSHFLLITDFKSSPWGNFM